MTVAILTDSSCDLHPNIMKTLDIHVIRSWIQLGVSIYKELNAAEVLEKMGRGEQFANAQPDDHDLRKVLQDLLSRYQHVILITVSSELGLFNSVARRVAAEMPGLVTVVDSRATSLGLGLQVYRAAELAQAGHTAPEILAALEYPRQHSLNLMVLRTLEFMRKNDRITGPQATVGKLIGLNPVLRVQNGKITAIARPRGFQVAVARMEEIAVEFGQQHPRARLAFSYAPGAETELAVIRENLLRTGLFQDMGIHAIGGVVAANTGPGCVGIGLEPAA